MEILVYLDEEDKKSIEELVTTCKVTPMQCDKAKEKFWYDMIDKYPVLRNRRLGLNAYDHFIFEWHSPRDLRRFGNLGQYYV